MIYVAAIITQVEGTKVISCRDGKKRNKRDVELTDESGSTTYTLWNKAAESFDKYNRWSIIIVRSAQKTSFNSGSITSVYTTIDYLNPSNDLSPRVKELRIWKQVSFGTL